MNISEIFNNPLCPGSSIQLNNKYWPSTKFTNLDLIFDCEESIMDRGFKDQRLQFHLKKLFPNEVLYKKMLKRLGKILCYQSSFGYEYFDLHLTESFLGAIKLTQSDYESSLKIDEFHELSRIVRKKYCAEYGWDFTTVHKSVRFSSADEGFLKQMSEFGPLSEYHNDELKGITCIVYLSNVARDNGAFSFIEGSEKIPRSPLLTAIHQTVCFDMGMSDWRYMETLPLEFRSTPLIGNFLEDEKAKICLQNEIVLEGVAGRGIIFNGQKLIHRGGKPVEGSRRAAFFAPEGIFFHKARSLFAISKY
jgi:hypothetical protein